LAEGLKKRRLLDQAEHEKAGCRVYGRVDGASGEKNGHAGAIVSGGKGKAEDKIRTLKECGISVCRIPTEMGETMRLALKC
jgi:succinyl-CoA synthetase alpha subunit